MIILIMVKKNIIVLMCILIFFAGCSNVDLSQMSDSDLERISEKAVVCNSPYIRLGVGCCLDKDQNNVCDVDETNNEQTTSVDDNVKVITDIYENSNFNVRLVQADEDEFVLHFSDREEINIFVEDSKNRGCYIKEEYMSRSGDKTFKLDDCPINTYEYTIEVESETKRFNFEVLNSKYEKEEESTWVG